MASELLLQLQRFEVRTLIAWTLALAIMLLPWNARRNTRIAWGLWSVPITLIVLGYLRSIPVLLDGGSVFAPLSERALSFTAMRKLLGTTGYVVAGAIVYGAESRDLFSTPLASLQAKITSAWRLPLVGDLQSLRVGFGILLPLALVGMGYEAILYGIGSLVNGQEADAFANMTWYHVVLLSLAAAVSEELVYRGVLQGALHRLHPWFAVGIQGLVFGLAHAGYGTFAHVLLPMGFGLLMGAFRLRWGLMGAILLHFGLDALAFSRSMPLGIGHAILGGSLVAGAAWSLRILRQQRHRAHGRF